VAALLHDYGIQCAGVFGPTTLKDGSPDPMAGDVDVSKVTVIGNTWGEFTIEKYAALSPQLLISHMFEPPTFWYVPDQRQADLDRAPRGQGRPGDRLAQRTHLLLPQVRRPDRGTDPGHHDRDEGELTVPAPTYEFFHPRVIRSQHLSPHLLRIVLGGDPGLARVVTGGRDQRFKLFLPQAGQDVPVLPDVLDDDWYARWRALDPCVRGIMRTYTVRDARTGPAEIDIDFALHGDLGPASRWARRAAPGDPVSLLAPVTEDNGGVDFRPPDGTDWILLTADETALPAVANILAWLPPDTRVRAFIEVGHPDDRQPLVSAADTEVTWLVRGGTDRTSALLTAVTTAAFPVGTPYAWVAGESAGVRGLRRHLVSERGFARSRITFTGYWRQGRTEDDLMAEAVAAAAAS